MREYGNVSVPLEAFIAALRMGEEWANLSVFVIRGQGNEDAVIIVQSAKFCSDFLRSRLCVYARSPKINHIN